MLRKHTMCSAINKTLSDRCTVSGVKRDNEKSSLSPWDLHTSPTTHARALGRDMRIEKWIICIGNNRGFPYSLNSRKINLSCTVCPITRGEAVTMCYAHDMEIKWQTHTASLLQFSNIVQESIKRHYIESWDGKKKVGNVEYFEVRILLAFTFGVT